MEPQEITTRLNDSTELSKSSEPCADRKLSDEQPATCPVCTGADSDDYCKDCCKCFKCRINSHQVTLEKNSFSFPLSIESPNSSLVTVPLSSLSCSVISSTPINTTVTSTDHPGVYRIHCTPVICGSHQVNIRVNKIQVESVSVVVPFNPYAATITPLRIMEGLDKLVGIAISNDGHIVIAESTCNSVTVLDKEGKKIKSFSTSGDIEFSYPRDIAITPDNFILVTDDRKIQKISMDGKFIASVGQEGTKPLEPWGITISPTTGQIYVADWGNHRIQVLNPDLTFSFSFGREESAEGQFQFSFFITIDNQGIVYVSDFSNCCIHKFTSDGKFLSTFGTRGSDPGQLYCPQGIAIFNNLLYVAEYGNHRVSIFSTDGKFIRCFGSHGTNKDQFHHPYGITIDNEGCLYICDFVNNRLVVY